MPAWTVIYAQLFIWLNVSNGKETSPGHLWDRVGLVFFGIVVTRYGDLQRRHVGLTGVIEHARNVAVNCRVDGERIILHDSEMTRQSWCGREKTEKSRTFVYLPFP